MVTVVTVVTEVTVRVDTDEGKERRAVLQESSTQASAVVVLAVAVVPLPPPLKYSHLIQRPSFIYALAWERKINKQRDWLIEPTCVAVSECWGGWGSAPSMDNSRGKLIHPL